MQVFHLYYAADVGRMWASRGQFHLQPETFARPLLHSTRTQSRRSSTKDSATSLCSGVELGEPVGVPCIGRGRTGLFAVGICLINSILHIVGTKSATK